MKRLTIPSRISLVALANAHKALSAKGVRITTKSALAGSSAEAFAFLAEQMGWIEEPFAEGEVHKALTYLLDQGIDFNSSDRGPGRCW